MVLADLERTSAWTYDKFQPGSVIGRGQMTIEPALLERWDELYPGVDRGGKMPMGATALILMQAYASILTRRPPGNVHVGQQCALHRIPRIGGLVDAEVTCMDKRVSGERRIVRLAIHVSDSADNGALVSGVMTLFWAL